MAVLKVAAFSGEQPRIIPRLLPPNAAKRAVDVRLDDGSLTPYRKPAVETTLGAGPPVHSIYRYGDDWLSFEGDANFARGPVADDRLYYTGDGKPKVLIAGPTIYDLAVPRPTQALIATLGGVGAGDKETRVYAFTYVTDLGEESEPSALSNSLDWKPGNSVTLANFPTVPTGRAISKQRIYRSQTGSQGTDLYFIAERSAANSNYVDTIPVDRFSEVIPSKLWNKPPDALAGLTAMPNGMMAAFVGRKLYFSEPFRPHAWPEVYIITVDWEIVGLSASGPSLWVLTKGQPYIVTGSHPSAMVSEKVEANYPCVNAQGIVDLGYAVAYPTNDGLAVASGGIVKIASGNIFTDVDWRRLSPATMRAGQVAGRWFATYAGTNTDGDPESGSFFIDLTGAQPFLIRSAIRARTWFFDIETGDLFFLDEEDGITIRQFNHPGAAPETLYWRSKEFVLPRPENFGVILVEASGVLSQAEIDARNAEIAAAIAANDALIATGSIGGEIAARAIGVVAIADDLLVPVPLPIGSTASVGVYGDGVLRATVGVTPPRTFERLPAGFTCTVWEIDVTTDVTVEQITLARTVDELKQAA